MVQFSLSCIRVVIFAFPLLQYVDGTKRTVSFHAVFSLPSVRGTQRTDLILKGGASSFAVFD